MPSLSSILPSLLLLGPRQLALYGVYQVGLRTGHYRRSMPVGEGREEPATVLDLAAAPFHVPGAGRLEGLLGEARADLLAEAEEVVAGKARLFGGPPVALELALPGRLDHWTVSERGKAHWLGGRDVKMVWEPGRFGWVYPLGRAYALTGDERYPRAFWTYAAEFLQANPPNLGPHWASAQEVALRLVALVYAAQVFAPSPVSAEWQERLPQAVAEHARRIPATLVYARSQNNNHLLTEALGLYTAGLVLPGHAEARRWRELGWKWLNYAFQNQIAPDGTYVQHSTNYHRLMLHAALLARAFAEKAGQALPEQTRDRLAAAVCWFAAQVDPESGEMTNLGANDGANILPLASAGFRDARPTLQAASRAFLGDPALPPGPWDELSEWVVGPGEKAVEDIDLSFPELTNSSESRIVRGASWASLRAVFFTSRPSHADQLHVDLWWRGINLARDAGTYLYNAPPPWDNSLAGTSVHNTVTVDGYDQMRRAGRFLWLDWAQASPVDPDPELDGPLGEETLAALHDGYRKLGVLHRRALTRLDERTWQVVDNLLPLGRKAGLPHVFRLHWLLPDWQWEPGDRALKVHSPYGPVSVEVEGSGAAVTLSVVRGGKVISGPDPRDPMLGWYSPTYGVKFPALSLVAETTGEAPVRLVTQWALEEF